MPTINVEISPTGETVIKVEGQCGPGCKDLTKAIEAAIGTTTGDVLTPEFHRSQGAPQTREQNA